MVRMLRIEGGARGRLEMLTVPPTVGGPSLLERAIGLTHVTAPVRATGGVMASSADQPSDEEQEQYGRDDQEYDHDRRHAPQSRLIMVVTAMASRATRH